MPRLLNKIALLIFLSCITQNGFSQSFQDDIQELRKRVFTTSTVSESETHRYPQFLLQTHPSAWVRYNPFTLSFGGLMWVYQAVITQQLSSSCLYAPTCSTYSKNLIQDYGLFFGIFLTADRLTRCNRLALYDYPLSEIDPHSHHIHQETAYYKLR